MAKNVNVGGIFAKIGLDTGEFNNKLKGLSGTIKNFSLKTKNAFQQIRQKGGTAFRALNAPIRAVTRSVNVLRSSFAKLSATLNPMRLAIAGLAGGFALLKIANTAEQATQAAVSFQKLTQTLGTDATTALKKLRSALKGTVSDMGIMQQVSNAAILGVGNNIDQMADIFKIARRLGQATGRTAEEALSDIVVGIGRQSRLILDNLGLIVSIAKANEAYAKKLGKTVDQLNDADKRMAFLTATIDGGKVALEKIGDEVETFAVGFQQLKAAISNFAVELSVRLAPAMTVLIKALRTLDFGSVQDGLVFLVEELLVGFSNWINNNGGKIARFFDSTVNGIVAITAAIKELLSSATGRLIAFFENPTLIGEAIGTYLKGLIDIWIGIGKLLGAALLSVFASDAKTITDIFKSAGKVFMAALKPLGTLFEGVLKGIDEMIRALPFVGETPRAERDRLIQERKELEQEKLKFLELADKNAKSEEKFERDRVARHMKNARERQRQINDLNKQIKDVELKIATPGEDFEKEIFSASKVAESGLQSVKDGADNLLKSLTGQTIATITKVMTDSVKSFEERMDKAAKDRAGKTVFGFEPLSDKEKAVAEQTISPVKDLSSQEIAEGFVAGTVESLTAPLNAVNTLLSDAKQVSENATGSLVFRTAQIVEAQEKIKRLLEIQKNIIEAQSKAKDIIAQQDEAKKKTTKDQTDFEKMVEDTKKRIITMEAEARVAALPAEEQKQALIQESLKIASDELDKLNLAFAQKQAFLRLLEKELQLKADAAEAPDPKAGETAAEQLRQRFTSATARGLIDGIEDGERAMTNFLRSFSGDFKKQLETALVDIGQKFSDIFGSQLKNVFGSEALAGILGFVGIMSQALSSESTVSEVPTEDIVASTTNVRGVVAGPESVAISQIGSSIREANRGVESLLTEIRDTLQSIEGSGLTSGGLGSAGLV